MVIITCRFGLITTPQAPPPPNTSVIQWTAAPLGTATRAKDDSTFLIGERSRFYPSTAPSMKCHQKAYPQGQQRKAPDMALCFTPSMLPNKGFGASYHKKGREGSIWDILEGSLGDLLKWKGEPRASGRWEFSRVDTEVGHPMYMGQRRTSYQLQLFPLIRAM